MTSDEAWSGLNTAISDEHSREQPVLEWSIALGRGVIPAQGLATSYWAQVLVINHRGGGWDTSESHSGLDPRVCVAQSESGPSKFSYPPPVRETIWDRYFSTGLSPSYSVSITPHQLSQEGECPQFSLFRFATPNLTMIQREREREKEGYWPSERKD